MSIVHQKSCQVVADDDGDDQLQHPGFKALRLTQKDIKAKSLQSPPGQQNAHQ